MSNILIIGIGDFGNAKTFFSTKFFWFFLTKSYSGGVIYIIKVDFQLNIPTLIFPLLLA